MLEDEPDIVAPVVANMVESLRARLQAAERVIRQARLKVQGDMAREDILPILDTPLPALPGLMAPPAQLSADPGAHGGPVPRYAMEDIWAALQGHPYFESWYAERGYALAWSDLMSAIRGERAVQDTVRAIDLEKRHKIRDHILEVLNDPGYNGGSEYSAYHQLANRSRSMQLADWITTELLIPRVIVPESLEKVIAKAMLDSWSDEKEHADSPLAIAHAIVEYLGAQEAAEGEWEHAVRDPAGRILFMPTAVPVIDGDVAIKRRPAGPWIEEQP